MQDAHKELLNVTFTKDNLQRRLVLLDSFFGTYFFTEGEKEPVKSAFKNFLIEQNAGDYLRSVLLNLSDNFFSSFTPQNYKQLIEQIRQEADIKPKLILYVATLLPPTEIEKLGRWVRENISEGLILDIEIDGSVVGGCAFVWNGVYHDYSLGYFMQKKRSEIISLLK